MDTYFGRMEEILKAILKVQTAKYNAKNAARDAVEFYLNSSQCSSQEYLLMYNHFASLNNMIHLDNTEDIYTTKNDFPAFVDYILKIEDNCYSHIYKMILETIVEEVTEGVD